MALIEHIDLTVPKGWNQCTDDQLEAIAAIILKQTAAASAFRPVSMFGVKAEAFFALAGLRVVRVEQKGRREDDISWCVREDVKDDVPFPLAKWQVVFFVNTQLKWMDDEKAQGLTRFPYNGIRMGRHWWNRHLYDGPATLMQDFTWQRYRYAQDYMELYVTLSNRLQRMIRRPRQFSQQQVKEMAKSVEHARCYFLATIYNGKVSYRDPLTGKREHGFHYVPSQSVANGLDFMRFDPIKWQVVILWWSGMMKYLQSKYKHVFKRQAPTSASRSTPLDLYTRTVATMEKYLGLNEETVNDQNFYIILQHMEDIAVSNEEMEKINRKRN